MKLSILIVNWNSREYLRKCLVSIQGTCAELNPQILVVDGGSFDGCGEMLAREFPAVEFVQSPENLGFARSNNLGFTNVKGEFLLLLNPDTELRPGAVSALLKALQQEPNAGMVGARQLNSDGSLQLSSIHRLPHPLRTPFTTRGSHWRYWRSSGALNALGPVPVEAVSGACMLLRSETFRKLGGFSPDYFMYAEDMDLCLQVQRAGFRIYHVPAAEIVHHGGGSSSSQASTFSTIAMRRALHAYFRKHHDTSGALLFRACTAGAALLRIALRLPALSIPGATRVNAWGTIRKWSTILRWSWQWERSREATKSFTVSA